MNEYLGTRAVAEWTGIPEETLRWWRHKGEGPTSFKLGRRVVYERIAVQNWIDSQRAATMTGGQVA